MKDITKIQKQILVDRYIRSEEGIKMLSIYEFAAITILASYMGKKNKCWPKQRELARVCRMSERKLQYVLSSLENKKIISIKRCKDKNIYSFNEFWLQEADKYLTKAHAAEAFVYAHAVRPDAHKVHISPIYNNKNNNSPSLQDFTSKKYKPAQSSDEPSQLLKEYTKH